MLNERWFKIGTGIIMAFIIIFLGTKITFIFKPIVVLVQTLFAPILISGVLFYLLRPIVDLLSKKIPRGMSILILYLGFIGLITIVVLAIGPELQKQFNLLIENFPTFANEVQRWAEQVQEQEWFERFLENDFMSLEDITAYISTYLTQITKNIGSTVTSTIGFIANIVIVLVIIPFVLFYMLKDGNRAPDFLFRLLPNKHHKETKAIISDMNEALSSYIQGQLLVSFCVGIMAYIGYLLIGLDYSLVLGLIAMLTNVIPFVGPWIGTFPAVIVGLLHSPFKALLVVIIVVVVQQIESNLISPQVMGRKLSIHPLTIIFLLLAAGQFAGILGLLLAVPTYALAKVVVSHVYRIIKLNE
ncbi:AI-2E family transporter [Bacillus chungangensis]|uniref:PurR-regulated permease PerM n=1 Tax=Bacillus chungangensis TaxID=587633 RepID=A0ABT9WYE4_9BACI|nr:AI-2E family transporter [Bacillus chungangensis]MDQ0178311.1 putative PurR-regulated permease PerM [Bacillus chungangensis]